MDGVVWADDVSFSLSLSLSLCLSLSPSLRVPVKLDGWCSFGG